MKSYTRGGDRGETGLFGGTRVPKDHPLVSACGTLDELNSALGAARAALAADASLKAVDEALARVQAECFALGAVLAAPGDKPAELPADATKRLESEIDAWDAGLPALKTFILPGGSQAGSALHLARAVSRRAEREAVGLAARQAVPEGVVAYLNRLSSWLFAAARWVNLKQGRPEPPWKGPMPGD
ncbi:MAG: ATP:cob(I)alamin adenosyltransferase [Elusimicrobia bacterium RBG_16_66_12]|nr:MAG: ATP:cob(I)alamin adenosyltransferase [Elusimicrobia bacterium RBG_16_66_12]